MPTQQESSVGEEAVQAIASVFARVGSAAEMRRFFDEILTAAETRDLALRWLLLRKLRAGMPQRRIADELGISLCKITRGSKLLKNRKSVTVRMLDDGHDSEDGEG
ncbi:MAG: transcriptional regulator [Lentisphaerae bacterium]|nr:transcriptional regulator [Lentisphaerota bacterium]